MYRLNYVIFSFAFLAALAPGQTPKLTTIPLAFEPNHGQAPQAIDFTSHGFGYALSLTPDSAWLQLFSGTKNTPAANAASVRLRLVGADATAHGEALDRQSGISNYFLGNDPNRWYTNVGTGAVWFFCLWFILGRIGI